MTTKRKQIIKAIAVSGSATIDDLVMTTGLERKNLHDNVKATLKDELCQRIKDDVTGQPLRKRGLSELKNSKALNCIVWNCQAKQRTEMHSNALCRFSESAYRVERLYRSDPQLTEPQGNEWHSTATRRAP